MLCIALGVCVRRTRGSFSAPWTGRANRTWPLCLLKKVSLALAALTGDWLVLAWGLGFVFASIFRRHRGLGALLRRGLGALLRRGLGGFLFHNLNNNKIGVSVGF